MSVNELASTRPFFTKSIHREVYDAIDPTKPSLALPGKTVLVTGAARGIGITIVESFAKAHAKTIILVGRSASALSSAQTKFEQSFPDVHFIAVPTDIGEPQSVDALFAGLKTQVDHIDILVNNAGVLSEYGPKTGDSDVDKWWTDMVSKTSFPLARNLAHLLKRLSTLVDHISLLVVLSNSTLQTHQRRLSRSRRVSPNRLPI